MGFFKTNGETEWYLGIWFASIPTLTYVWVANRERPIKNPSLATLEITEDGKLVLKEDSRTIVWETNNLEKASDVKLLEQGNLVYLRDLFCGLKLKDLVSYIDKFGTWLLCCFKLDDKQFHQILLLGFWKLVIGGNLQSTVVHFPPEESIYTGEGNR
ncbi:hypothetical protein K7X08_017005 [Anisodus acutangulus]|uniref:Bulb-type lectin domain-containing protein n=1 Tax=Anisodus acutangulus TaxID=402998 RepID=A0A9Q1LTQ7_9SOLA|nr:hypothetical protein K7X08_017005 [Anisodus acutangulus]